MRFGLDSTGPISGAAHQAVGSTVAIRYLSRSMWKVVTRAEYVSNLVDGIDTCLVFEDSATNALKGYEQGKADAEWGLKQAIDILGRPKHNKVRFSLAADYDPTGQEARTDAYYDGAGAVLGHPETGPYGGYSLIAHAAGRGFGLLFGTYAWSDGREFAGVKQQQYSNDHTVGGVGCDYDHIHPDKNGDFGQYELVARTPLFDPYALYGEGPYPWKGVRLFPQHAARRYDHLRDHRRPVIFAHRKELAVLRHELLYCAERVYFEAHWGKDGEPGGKHHGMPPRWRHNHYGRQFQEFIHRAQGQRVHG